MWPFFDTITIFIACFYTTCNTSQIDADTRMHVKLLRLTMKHKQLQFYFFETRYVGHVIHNLFKIKIILNLRNGFRRVIVNLALEL